MKKFQHFVITRFNIKQNYWETDRNGKEINDSKWLENRYDLFNNYCLPTLKCQSNQNFYWLVYFDIDTPKKYRDINNRLGQNYQNFIPKYIENSDEFLNAVRADIQSFSVEESEYIITTRIDNDDGFHKDTINVIHKSFVESDMTIIDLVNGIKLQVCNGYKLSIRKNVRLNPFISLIEKKGTNMKTVYFKKHKKWGNEIKRIVIKDGYYWVQIIHDSNVYNSLNNRLSANKDYLKGFCFAVPVSFSFSYFLLVVYLRILKIPKYFINKFNIFRK